MWIPVKKKKHADGCKQKEKRKKRKRKNLLSGSEHADGPVGVRACGWACSHVGMWMRMAVNKKKKGKKEKEKTY